MKAFDYKRIRIGNIEYVHDPDYRKNFTFEHAVLRWFRNSHYGKLEEYLNNGYIEKDGFLEKDNMSLDKQLFRSPELNCVIAHLDFNVAGDEYDIVSVGRRVIDLSDNEMKDFKRIMDIFDEELYGANDLKD